MEIQLIETSEDYAKAIKEIDSLMSDAGSAAGLRLERLAKLVQEYEAKHFAIDGPAKPPEKK
jgi:antitoxin component HigA of HigAB toxin-antitoxin module